MGDTVPIEGLRDASSVDPAAFDDRVSAEAERLIEHVEEGTFDNPQAIVGLEYELYGVERPNGGDGGGRAAGREGGDGPAPPHLVRIPRSLLTQVNFEKELGLHNAELHTAPHPCNGYGLRAQLTEVQARLSAALAHARAADVRLVSDGLWTVPPRGEPAGEYLTDAVDREEFRVATNVSDAVRYHGFANGRLETGCGFSVPHATVESDVAAPASLTTTVQPHYQVPRAADLPDAFGDAVRVAGPLLALGVNSPLLPPDLYDDDASPEAILSDGRDEHRIPVFEGTMNPVDAPPKVRFPRDVATPAEAVERIADDPVVVPAEIEAGTRFDDAFRHLRHKHGSYWRWVRPVFDGASEATANARVEFRPLPAQPTVHDSVSFVAAFAGLLAGIDRTDHPVRDLPWETARENFYAAVDDGIDADLTWIDADGTETTDRERIYADLFETAATGLAARDVPPGERASWLEPLRDRVDRGRTPADWKRAVVRERLAEGDDFETAVYAAQRRYVDRQAETLLDGTFAEWPDPA